MKISNKLDTNNIFNLLIIHRLYRAGYSFSKHCKSDFVVICCARKMKTFKIS